VSSLVNGVAGFLGSLVAALLSRPRAAVRLALPAQPEVPLPQRVLGKVRVTEVIEGFS
jgi:hypothetical protein